MSSSLQSGLAQDSPDGSKDLRNRDFTQTGLIGAGPSALLGTGSAGPGRKKEVHRFPPGAPETEISGSENYNRRQTQSGGQVRHTGVISQITGTLG